MPSYRRGGGAGKVLEQSSMVASCSFAGPIAKTVGASISMANGSPKLSRREKTQWRKPWPSRRSHSNADSSSETFNERPSA